MRRYRAAVADDYALMRKQEADEGYVLARLRVLTPEEGGRSLPILNGYRSCWDIGATYEGEPCLNDAPLLIEGADRIELGEEVNVRLHPLLWDFWQDIHVGQRIEMREGSRTVGVATILERVDPAG
jgi:translation elongation factor EF-Tu-like GTPase